MNNKSYRKEYKPKLNKKQKRKAKLKRKEKQETSRLVLPVEVRDIQPDTPPQTPTMPGRRRGR